MLKIIRDFRIFRNKYLKTVSSKPYTFYAFSKFTSDSSYPLFFILKYRDKARYFPNQKKSINYYGNIIFTQPHNTLQSLPFSISYTSSHNASISSLL